MQNVFEMGTSLPSCAWFAIFTFTKEGKSFRELGSLVVVMYAPRTRILDVLLEECRLYLRVRKIRRSDSVSLFCFAIIMRLVFVKIKSSFSAAEMSC